MAPAKDDEKRKWCRRLRTEGKSVQEICEITGLKPGTVRNYTAGYTPGNVSVLDKKRQYGIDLLVDWTVTVNIGRQWMGLKPFEIPTMEDA